MQEWLCQTTTIAPLQSVRLHLSQFEAKWLQGFVEKREEMRELPSAMGHVSLIRALVGEHPAALKRLRIVPDTHKPEPTSLAVVERAVADL